MFWRERVAPGKRDQHPCEESGGGVRACTGRRDCCAFHPPSALAVENLRWTLSLSFRAANLDPKTLGCFIKVVATVAAVRHQKKREKERERGKKSRRWPRDDSHMPVAGCRNTLPPALTWALRLAIAFWYPGS